MLMALAGALTYILIPQIVIKIFDLSGISEFLSKGILPFVNLMPLPELEQFGLKSPTAYDVAIFTIHSFFSQILIQYTLPLRSILWSLWYKNLNSGISKTSSSKRPSERLMEKSHKKYGKKKLDRNILKRASEKDEEI